MSTLFIITMLPMLVRLEWGKSERIFCFVSGFFQSYCHMVFSTVPRRRCTKSVALVNGSADSQWTEYTLAIYVARLWFLWTALTWIICYFIRVMTLVRSIERRGCSFGTLPEFETFICKSKNVIIHFCKDNFNISIILQLKVWKYFLALCCKKR